MFDSRKRYVRQKKMCHKFKALNWLSVGFLLTSNLSTADSQQDYTYTAVFSLKFSLIFKVSLCFKLAAQVFKQGLDVDQ